MTDLTQTQNLGKDIKHCLIPFINVIFPFGDVAFSTTILKDIRLSTSYFKSFKHFHLPKIIHFRYVRILTVRKKESIICLS